MLDRSGRAALPAGDAGFSLMEAMVATLIATLAVIGLAHSFGLGRAFINRFEVARAGLATAQERLEILHVTPLNSTDFSMDSTHVQPFYHLGRQVGLETWHVGWYDDPEVAGAENLRRVTVTVSWNTGSLMDSLSLTRLFLAN